MPADLASKYGHIVPCPMTICLRGHRHINQMSLDTTSFCASPALRLCALCRQGGVLPVWGVIRELVRPSTRPQCDQICDPAAAAQRQGPGHLSQRTLVHEQALQRRPRRWATYIHCWQQPAVVWIHQTPADTTAKEQLLFLKSGLNRCQPVTSS